MAEHGRHHHPRRRYRARSLAAAAVGLALLGALATGAGLASAAQSPAEDSGGAVPCATTAKACARLSTHEVWVTDGAGTVLRGPVRMNDGGDDDPTPPGSYTVQRKNRWHVSQESGASMPYSVFFDGQGRAFHEGDPARQSAGCIRLAREDAQFVFENLDIGDAVQIVE